jgi:hypothetical protein
LNQFEFFWPEFMAVMDQTKTPAPAKDPMSVDNPPDSTGG